MTMTATEDPAAEGTADGEDFADNDDEEVEAELQVRDERVRRRNRIVLFLILAAMVAFVVVDSLTNKYVASALSSLYHWVDSHPLPGAFVLTVVIFAATLAFIPGALLTIGCGVVYGMILGLGRGVAVGSLILFIGSSFGSLASFVMGRYLLQECVGRWLDRYPLFKAVDKAMEKKGFRVFFLLRLSPIIPFNALNYMAGMTSVTMRDYTLALIGLLPGTVLYVFVGSSAGSAMESDDTDNVRKNARIASIVVGIVVGIVGIIAVSYYAKKELNHIIAEQDRVPKPEDLEQQLPSHENNEFHPSSTEISG